ncbi:cinnamoyl-CoA reductase-like SNL6 [Ricinus communis]|uniref:Cinnamoyl-CoA reductase, putative n=1 Tax=Ricinus communis TaxID=3988 RepID=B9SF82_RICCO|nr:cinnamoyl-CoA reductase-like SNL6 [Ricinus communis]EEF37670.1 cinnamoyl-CoA reductase, putative [Ricinus communis]|eukprot:XP_002524651.1 cinnamoyl-CoA reductase-like SNL6 [Ricinus communis]
MGFLETEERRMVMEFEMEEIKRILVACSARKDDQQFKEPRVSSSEMIGDCDKSVCVTSGVSFLGLAIVNRLLRRGYSVKIIVHTEEEMEKLRELETSGEMRSSNSSIKAVMAKLTEIESLLDAFDGCRGVFHTSAFTDPAGLSGYTKSMAEVEVKACENVIMACSRTPSVRHCVLTSSLLACIWRDGFSQDLSPVINHDSWSDESLCADKKLWYALGKLRAEKAAWRIAKEKGLKLATICPGLITGPDFFHRNPTATIAYLKGAQEMFGDGLLATTDVMKLAEAQACVLEGMDKRAFGRYICFDNIIERKDEAEKLAKEIGMPANKICGTSTDNTPARFELSNKKLLNLMSRTLRTCFNQS